MPLADIEQNEQVTTFLGKNDFLTKEDLQQSLEGIFVAFDKDKSEIIENWQAFLTALLAIPHEDERSFWNFGLHDTIATLNNLIPTSDSTFKFYFGRPNAVEQFFYTSILQKTLPILLEKKENWWHENIRKNFFAEKKTAFIFITASQKLLTEDYGLPLILQRQQAIDELIEYAAAIQAFINNPSANTRQAIEPSLASFKEKGIDLKNHPVSEELVHSCSTQFEDLTGRDTNTHDYYDSHKNNMLKNLHFIMNRIITIEKNRADEWNIDDETKRLWERFFKDYKIEIPSLPAILATSSTTAVEPEQSTLLAQQPTPESTSIASGETTVPALQPTTLTAQPTPAPAPQSTTPAPQPSPEPAPVASSEASTPVPQSTTPAPQPTPEPAPVASSGASAPAPQPATPTPQPSPEPVSVTSSETSAPVPQSTTPAPQPSPEPAPVASSEASTPAPQPTTPAPQPTPELAPVASSKTTTAAPQPTIPAAPQPTTPAPQPATTPKITVNTYPVSPVIVQPFRTPQSGITILSILRQEQQSPATTPVLPAPAPLQTSQSLPNLSLTPSSPFSLINAMNLANLPQATPIRLDWFNDYNTKKAELLKDTGGAFREPFVEGDLRLEKLKTFINSLNDMRQLWKLCQDIDYSAGKADLVTRGADPELARLRLRRKSMRRHDYGSTNRATTVGHLIKDRAREIYGQAIPHGMSKKEKDDLCKSIMEISLKDETKDENRFKLSLR